MAATQSIAARGTDGAHETCPAAALRARVMKILLAEHAYWANGGDADSEQLQSIRVGAVGAVSNVIAALTGHPAAWHPQETQPSGGETCHT